MAKSMQSVGSAAHRSRARGRASTVVLGLCQLLLACARPHASPTPSPPPERAPAPPEAVLASTAPLMPHPVTSFGAAVHAGMVYALGGYDGVPHAYNAEGQSGALWRYDPGQNDWQKVAEVPHLQGPALVSVPEGVLRIGGMRAQNAKGAAEDLVSVAEVETYVPAEGRFRPLAALADGGRSSHAAAYVAGRVYVVGGWSLAGGKQSGKFATQMLELDPSTGQTRALPQPFQRRALAAAALGDKLYVLGGLSADGAISKETWVFSPADGSWKRGPDFPGDGFGLAATSDGHTLIASDRSGGLHRLATPEGPWSELGRLAFPRFFHQLVQLDSQHIVALGGITGMHLGARVRPVEVIELTQSGVRSLRFELKNPTNAKNRQGTFVIGDSLYVFGGNRSLAQHDFAAEDFVAEGARIDLADLSLHPIAPFPVARQTVQTFVGDERVFALGGFGHDGERARAHADGFSYDVDDDRWTPDPQVMPEPRTQFGFFEYKGVRWVFGGLDFDPARGEQAQFHHPREVLKAAPGEPFKVSEVVLPRARRAFGGALLDDRYYLIGGMAEGFATIRACDVFNLETAVWTEIACPEPRVSPQLVALDGALYLAGGSRPGEGGKLEPATSLQRYDPKANSWTTVLEELPLTATHLTMQPFHGSLLVYSAHQEDPRIKLAIITP